MFLDYIYTPVFPSWLNPLHETVRSLVCALMPEVTLMLPQSKQSSSSKQQTSLRDTKYSSLLLRPWVCCPHNRWYYGDKNRLIQQTLGRSCVSFPPTSPPYSPHHKKPSCYLMFHENQLAGHISACKWNDLFPWNLQDLKDIFPLPARVTQGLPALTFDKKGRLQLPAACQHQTVTFQTTVNFTDL